ncbi:MULTISPECIES: hypothetical protein [unclassified Sinorhizobium]|uniref:hypothetical protein n=1 Tax=unclassified Sinorhizobium TaxID=2613772 RepID=UPI0035242327
MTIPFRPKFDVKSVGSELFLYTNKVLHIAAPARNCRAEYYGLQVKLSAAACQNEYGPERGGLREINSFL